MNKKKVYKVENKYKFNLNKMGSDFIKQINVVPITYFYPYKSLDTSFEFEDSNCDSCKILFSQLIVTNSNDGNTYERTIYINNIN